MEKSRVANATPTISIGSERCSIIQNSIKRDEDAGTVTFLVTGIKGSESRNDVTIEVKSGDLTGTKDITVIVPDRIKRPAVGIVFQGPVVPRMRATNTKTSPASILVKDGDNKNQFSINWMTHVTVEVVDKWGESLGDLYEKSEISQSGININSQLSAQSNYIDPVGVGVSFGVTTPDVMDPVVWESKDVSEEIRKAKATTPPQIRLLLTEDSGRTQVEVDGLPIGGTGSRPVLVNTETNELLIEQGR